MWCLCHTKEKCLVGNETSTPVMECNDAHDMVLGDQMNILEDRETLVKQVDMAKDNPEVLDEGFGPWMLIDYKSRRKSVRTESQKKGNISGSRFSVLHQEDKDKDTSNNVVADTGPSMQENKTVEPGEINDKPPSSKTVPEIIQMWTCLQSALKEKEILGPGIVLDSAKDVVDISGLKHIPSMPISGNEPSFPLVDISNSDGPKSRLSGKILRKNAGPLPRAKCPIPVKNPFSFGNQEPSASNFSGFFGRCPPEEVVNKKLVYNLDANMGGEISSSGFNADVTRNAGHSDPSSLGEDSPDDM